MISGFCLGAGLMAVLGLTAYVQMQRRGESVEHLTGFGLIIMCLIIGMLGAGIGGLIAGMTGVA